MRWRVRARFVGHQQQWLHQKRLQQQLALGHVAHLQIVYRGRGLG
jgi:hypothetical protein